MDIKYPIKNPHTLSVAEVLQAFQTDISSGISQAEAEARANIFGPNIYQAQKQKSRWLMWLLQFKSPIVYLLFVAAALTFYLEDYIESGAIMVVILVNAVIGFLMELQARSSMNALREMDVILSRVVRGGEIREIPSEQVTPGDLIVLEAGDVIPGDARLVETHQLQCDESSLTGESLPTGKNTEALPKDTALGDRLNMVFKGAAVINGNGKAVVTGIAAHTQLGTIASLVAGAKEKQTPLDKRIAALSKKLIWLTLVMIAIFAGTGFVQGKDWALIVETSIALAVAAFPEGLPIVATVALAYGMLQMARRNAIVKRLSAVETLGSTHVIVTDKTGTLTENKIYVDTLSFPEESARVRIEEGEMKWVQGNLEKSEAAFQKLRLVGALCNDVAIGAGTDEKGLGDPIEIALIALADAAGTSAQTLKAQHERIREVPFNSNIKMMGTLHKSGKDYFVAAKGSVEHLLEKCSQIQTGDAIGALDEAKKNAILLESENMAGDGLRVLAFACKTLTEPGTGNFLNELVYVGMIGFLDPPRLDIREAIRLCRKAGIRIVMITGDHPLTALNIAKSVGLVDAEEEKFITGSQLPDMEALSAEWNARILDTAVFARTTPKQKLEIVATYQQAGNIVAMTGDGVNDAPALKKADIGIAMGLRGTQVAKETASIVLKDDSFTSIAQAVAQGRVIFQNIQKFVIYLVSCNLSEIFIVTILGFIAPASTLLPLQILFLNMVTDVFPALALGLGKGDKTVMDQPPRDPEGRIVSSQGWLTIGLYAAAMTLAVIVATVYCAQTLTTDARVINNVAFITLAFSQLFHVFNMASARSPLIVNDITKNKFVWYALVLCFGLVALVYALPLMQVVLGLQSLPVEVWAVALIASLIPLVLVQAYKLIRGRGLSA